MSEHSLELHQDDGGWDYGVCTCGWQTPPVPGADIVADAYADHRLTIAGVDHTPSVVVVQIDAEDNPAPAGDRP